MHPNPAFSWTDRAQMLDFVAAHSFAHIFTASEAGQFVVHAPVIVQGESILFHVARRNRIADQLDGRPVLISVLGRHAYQSANWYASADQVPTWHYEAVEADGIGRGVRGQPPDPALQVLLGHPTQDRVHQPRRPRADPVADEVDRAVSEEELVALVDRLSDTMEGRYSPARRWSRAEMSAGKFEALVKAIIGFEVRATAVRGTRKFNQSKSGEDRAATIEGQRGAGRDDVVAAIEELMPRGE